jgi:FkbM family methyltransferase
MTLPDHLIAKNQYGQYCVPRASSDRPAAATVLAGMVWEESTIALIAKNCGRGDVVHAGTYFGDFLPALSQALSPGAQLWAFEPSRENHACAQCTVELNDLKNVTLSHAGLGARNSEGAMCVAADGVPQGGGSRITKEKIAGQTLEDIQLMALDNVVPEDREISVIQLDVEDYEQQALKGALGILKRCKPLLILEMLPRNLKWHANNILSLGYREIGQVHRNRVLTASPIDPIDFDTLRDGPNERAARRARRRAVREALPRSS